MREVNSIIGAITEHNNKYRNPISPPWAKLAALWDIGNVLYKMGITKPHSIGWAIQRETRGLIKRPTVFRSHKIRTIWPTKSELEEDLGGIKNLSNVTEILPLIDPAQPVRKRMSESEVTQLYHHACSDRPGVFKNYVKRAKKVHGNGKLGRMLDRSRHLSQVQAELEPFSRLRQKIDAALNRKSAVDRDRLREDISAPELAAFSNFCISLTTKENYRLYKNLPPAKSSAREADFKELYERFRGMLEKTSDVERARVRRIISAETFAQMSDMVSSLMSEQAVLDYQQRKRLAINL